MKRFAAKMLSMLLVLAMMLSLFASMTVASAAPAKPSKNTAARHQICTSLSDQAKAYYTGNYDYEIVSNLQGGTDNCLTATTSAMYTRLQTLMTDTQTYNCTYSKESAGSLAYYWKSTDTAKGTSNFLLFYSDTEGGGFNREHVWPKSRASFYQSNGGSDLHHLRPADNGVNSARSNYTMGNVRNVSSSYTTYEYGGKTVLWIDKSRDMVEINDNIKGDVARIYLYVYTRWGERNLFMTDPDPKTSSDDKGGNNGLRVIDNLATLLQWCKEDPVDEWEMKRNDLTQQVQGNRNVFIDYPEYAWLLFGQEVPDDMVTPSGEAANQETFEITAVANNADYGTVTRVGKTITATPKTGYTVVDATVTPAGAATVTRKNNTFTLSNVTANCTVTVNFAAKTAASVTYQTPNGVTCAATHGYVGDTVKLATPTGKPASNENATFIGWSESKVEATSDKPEVRAAGSSYTLAGNQTFYAVYSFQVDGETRYAFDPVICDHAQTKEDHLDPTCDKPGYDRVVCLKCGTVLEETVLAATGHTFTSKVVEPTCSSKGYTEEVCTKCGYRRTTNLVPALPHTWDEGVVTKEPTATSNGIRTYTCTVCGATKNEKIPATGDDKPDPTEPTEPTEPSENPTKPSEEPTEPTKPTEPVEPTAPAFDDVKENAYYAPAVEWAVDQGITNGTAANTFSPEDPCTRAQVVTFLWRAAGSPEPETRENPFRDIAQRDYYYKAVLWAVDQGITTGTTADTFSPEDPCTRAQVVTFLYRGAGKPAVSGENRFADVAETDYFYAPVVWAVREGITTGKTETSFAPNDTCTRAQIVTFLYRDFV